jgi:beta-lactamase regulating signal transducer with metallopeptidase domain
MTSEVLAALVRMNLAAAAAILAVLALRLPARRWLGPETAYRLWAIPPLATLATLLPPRVDAAAADPGLTNGVIDAAPLLVADYAVGVAIVFALLWRAQAKFLREARAGKVGPSVVGVIAPRILMPPDDGRYTAQERALIRAHEREHVARKDPRGGALAAAAQCLLWLNPLVHLAAHLVRLDQELACDAAVMRRHSKDRALYAKTLLKTQLAATPLPFGCYWPARGTHPLEVRIGLLKRAPRHTHIAGSLAVAAAAFAAGWTAWASQPPVQPHMPYAVQVWQHQPDSHMSVMLISAPRGAWGPRPAQ